MKNNSIQKIWKKSVTSILVKPAVARYAVIPIQLLTTIPVSQGFHFRNPSVDFMNLPILCFYGEEFRKMICKLKKWYTISQYPRNPVGSSSKPWRQITLFNEKKRCNESENNSALAL